MVSAWWIAAAFIGGGWAGVLLMALLTMAAHRPKRSDVDALSVSDLDAATVWR
jgi:hypothetical protein